MEKFKEPLPPFRYLVDSFFRLHRRRQFSQHGYQPFTYQEMADFAERVLKLHPTALSLFYRAIEATDNAVLYDHFQKNKAETDAALEEAKKPGKGRPPKGAKGGRK